MLENNDEKQTTQTKKTKTYAYWLSVLSATLLVVVQVLAIFKIYVETKVISDIISSVLGLLVVAGILIGPIKTDEKLGDVSEEKQEEKDEE